jgi:lipopolysaccharide transport system permease protein
MQDLLIIESGRRESHYWLELWRYRELFMALARRDLSVRYKQTIVGVLWALIRPLLAVLVFTIIFGHIAKLPSTSTAPYAVMVFVGMLPWTFFASSLTDGSNSLINNSNLVSKIYFPRMILPSATLVVAFVDFLINFCILFVMMVWYRIVPGWHVLFLPVFMVLGCIASLGPSLWITALNVKYRDFRYVIPFIVQFGLYVSPVGFDSNIVPEQWRLLYSLNPMVGVIDGFRWSLLGGSQLYISGFILSACVAGFFLWFGISQFRKMEKKFADLI